MKQRILVISQYFYPEEFRINDICKELVKRRYEVTVVTGIPNYPQGRFYEGFGWFKRRKEEYEGVHIIRLPIVPRGTNPVMLILNYFSFMAAGFFWQLFSGVRADKVLIFEVSPMTQALVGVWYAGKHNIPCYIYVQDLWPENVEIVSGIHNKTIIRAIDQMVDYIYRNCERIFATSPSFVRRLEERASVRKGKESKVLYWPQYAEGFYHPVEKAMIQDMPEDGKFKIVFTGNIGYAQGLDILPEAAVLLKQKGIDCEFIIIGDGRNRKDFERAIIKNGVQDMFCLLGRKKPEEIPHYLAHCDVAFLSFADNPLFCMTIPAKLQSYMACGMPILAVADGETKRIIEEAECGWVAPMGNVEQFADIVNIVVDSDESILNEMQQNSLAYCNIHFNKELLLDNLEAILE